MTDRQEKTDDRARVENACPPEFEFGATVPVSDIMVRDILCLSPETSLLQALRALEESDVEAAPVVDVDGRPLGTVTREGLALALRSPTRRESVPEVRARTFDGAHYRLERGYHMETHAPVTVADMMQPAVVIPELAPVVRAAGLMRWETAPLLLVTSYYGEVVGVVKQAVLRSWFERFVEHLPPLVPSAQEASPPKLSDAHRKTVLVVDDDAAICEGVVDLLEDEGFEAIRAPNGKRALEILHSLPEQPGLILLDLMMPEMNGWEFRQEQLRDQRLRPIPVVVLTAHGRSLSHHELEAPAAVLRKPVTVDTLMHAVMRHYQFVN